ISLAGPAKKSFFAGPAVQIEDQEQHYIKADFWSFVNILLKKPLFKGSFAYSLRFLIRACKMALGIVRATSFGAPSLKILLASALFSFRFNQMVTTNLFQCWGFRRCSFLRACWPLKFRFRLRLLAARI